MVGAELHQPRHAAGNRQLRHAGHRAARSGEGARGRAAHARLGDPRVHDRLDGARAHVRSPQRPLRPQARVRRRLRRLHRRIAGRGLRDRRDGPDPLAHRAGHRRRAAVCQRQRAGHRRVPARAARHRDGNQRDGRGRRPRPRPVLGGALVEISWHWVFWFNVPLGLPARCGRRSSCASSCGPRSSTASTGQEPSPS